jgi:hypothetical protein
MERLPPALASALSSSTVMLRKRMAAATVKILVMIVFT